jgi:hypothetical protein
MKGRRGRVTISGSMHLVKRFFIEASSGSGFQEVTEDEYNRSFPPKDIFGFEPLCGHHPKGWPMHSEALAVHPDQVDEANARARRHGIACRYERGTGVCEIDSEADKSKLVRLEGFVNKQAGYNG